MQNAAASDLPAGTGPSPGGSSRWLLLLALGWLALAAGYATLVVGTARWQDARALDQLFPYYDWHIRSFGAGAWRQLQSSLALLAAGLAAALALGAGPAASRRELAAAGAEVRQLGRRLAGQWQALSRFQKRFLVANLLVLTAVRVGLSLVMPWADDAVSFEFFVRQPLLAVAAYYPLPNNHLLANTLAWGFYQLHPGFWWATRLPVLLTSTAGSGLLFVAMWRRLGYWPALLAAGGMSWVQLSLYHAVVGRGYWLVVVMVTLLFAAVLRLAEPAEPGTVGAGFPGQGVAPAAPGPALGVRLAWAGLVGAGILGSYAVPTFAYALGSAFAWLGWRALWQRRWLLLGEVVAMGAVVGGAVALLYAPVLFVSGLGALVHNPFVVQLGASRFWEELPAYAWATEGYLLGQRSVGAALTLGVLAAFAGLLARARRLPASLAQAVRQVGGPALWFVGAPYVLLAAQRVLPPERVLLYKSWFFFLLLALVLAAWMGRGQRVARRWLVGLGMGLFISYQLGTQVRLIVGRRRELAGREAVYEWLGQHPEARPALIPDHTLWLWLRLRTHTSQPTGPYPADELPRPGCRYPCVVVLAGSPAPAGAGSLWYAAGSLRVLHGPTPPVSSGPGKWLLSEPQPRPRCATLAGAGRCAGGLPGGAIFASRPGCYYLLLPGPVLLPCALSLLRARPAAASCSPTWAWPTKSACAR